jgi:tRNA-splicing ligase RtcB
MKTAMRLPVAVSGAMMPDAHTGYALPIGGVVALDRAVSPAFVGYDIACRMTLTIFDITVADFMACRDALAADLRAVTRFGKGSNFGRRQDHPVMTDPCWLEMRTLRQHRDLAWQQLGSSGGGNHFADLVVGEVTAKSGQDLTVDWLPLPAGSEFVALMTHSGSRGTGHKLATHYVKLAAAETARMARGIPRGYEWLSTESEAGQEYLAVMGLMGDYAQACHQLVHDGFAKRAGIAASARFENHHNFAWVQDDLVVHRKGATPANLGRPGIIPGTSGSPSFLVAGLGNEASLCSSSHGAGRPFSRTEAKRRHDPEFVKEWMTDNDIIAFGLAPDETVMAYKDIEHVMALQAELVQPVATMYPKVVIMGGGKSDDGD